MTMTIVVTRNAPGRYRGFLASCMLEIAPGIYASPKIKKAVRERIWRVMLEWHEALPDDGGIVMFWADKRAPSGMGMHVVGYPKKTLLEHEGMWLAQGYISPDHPLLHTGPSEDLADPSALPLPDDDDANDA